jgi:hypothetical protein
MKKLKSGENEYDHDFENEQGHVHNFNMAHNLERKKSVIFSSRDIIAGGFESKFDIVFSSGNIDLSRVQIPLYDRSIKIDMVFSSGRIKINENIPMVISVKSLFSSVQLPDRNGISFGGYDYVTRSFREGQPALHIRIDSIFSSTDVVRAEGI